MQRSGVGEDDLTRLDEALACSAIGGTARFVMTATSADEVLEVVRTGEQAALD